MYEYNGIANRQREREFSSQWRSGPCIIVQQATTKSIDLAKGLSEATKKGNKKDFMEEHGISNQQAKKIFNAMLIINNQQRVANKKLLEGNKFQAMCDFATEYATSGGMTYFDAIRKARTKIYGSNKIRSVGTMWMDKKFKMRKEKKKSGKN